jgi:hypothetical protein
MIFVYNILRTLSLSIYTAGGRWSFCGKEELETCFPAVSSGNTKETAFGLTKKGKPGACFRKKHLQNVFP